MTVLFLKENSLVQSLEKILKEAEISVRQGTTQIILTDINISEEKLPIPMLLCVGAINKYLIEKKLRGYVSINVQTGEALGYPFICNNYWCWSNYY